MIEKDAAESTTDLKVISKGGAMIMTTKKKVLEMGLSAANQMKNLQTQTYYNRSVNACVQYDPNDFIGKLME